MDRIIVGLLLTGLLVTQVAAQVCYTYRTVDIATPAGEQGQTSLEAISHTGTLLGRYANQEPPDGYTVVRKGEALRVYAQSPPVAGQPSWPRAINAQRDIVGQVQTEAGFMGYLQINTVPVVALTAKKAKAAKAVKRAQAAPALRTLATATVHLVAIPGALSSEALGINLQRDVVGYYYDATDVLRGFRWTPDGQVQTIDAPGSLQTMLTGINAHAEMVGWFMDAAGMIHGLHVVEGIAAPLDVPGALYTFLADINDHGSMVGLHTQGEYGSGFLYQDGSFYDVSPGVGELHSEAMGISNTGEIVGNYLDQDGRIHGYVATPQAPCASEGALVALE